jgi:hypothetical protein
MTAESAWGIFSPIATLFVFVFVAYILDRTFHESVMDFFRGFLQEAGDFGRRKPNFRSLNMLFGILIFIVVILLVAAVAVSTIFGMVTPQHYAFHIPGDLIILSALFLLFVFFSLSLAFCRRVER